jgi:hypothetical protein
MILTAVFSVKAPQEPVRIDNLFIAGNTEAISPGEG